MEYCQIHNCDIDLIYGDNIPDIKVMSHHLLVLQGGVMIVTMTVANTNC
jgi:hypothetical protein